MASVFSYYAAALHYSSNPHDQLTQSSRPHYSLHSPHPIPDSNWTIELIRLLIATIVNPLIRNSRHPFIEPRRMTPACL